MDTVFPVMSTKEKDSLSIRLFGNRLQGDQTLGEYLLEFLLVFSSAKKDDESGKFEFHTMDQINQAQTAGALSYYTVPRNGLKRFIFYDRSKQESRSAIDTLAYKNMLSMLQKKSEDPDWPYILQDLLYGYALIIRKRGWYAQSLMPIAPELLFPETLGIKARKNKPLDTPNIEVETMFEYGQHDFLARGGEMYYLQLLEGIYKNQDDPKFLQYKKDIERGISYMLKEKSAGFSTIATHLQNWWLEDQNLNDESIYAAKLTRKMSLGYLQPGFDRRAKQSLQELACFLSNEIHPITRIDLMSKGIVLALLRSMHLQAFYCVHPDAQQPPAWIIDMHTGSATSNIAKLAAASYRTAYSEFGNALNIIYANSNGEKEAFDVVSKELSDSADIFKKMGKELQIVIPRKGAYERFSLSEDIVRYLVLLLVRPGKKMTFDSFLQVLYDHYGIVIGAAQYAQLKENVEPGMGGYFDENQIQFQMFLKNCGLLRDLSDATSIVENPYAEVKFE